MNSIACDTIAVGDWGSAPASQDCDSSAGERQSEFYALQEHEGLFKAGDLRTEFYKVEAGALLVSYPDETGKGEAYEIAYPGDYVGFGFLQHHTATAIAITETTVSCQHNEDASALEETDPVVRKQRSKAIEREFLSRRASCTQATTDAAPIQKIARLLVALSSVASRQGCGLQAVSDLLESRFVAEFLGMEVEYLADRVRALSQLGYVQVDTSTGVLLHDLEGLEALC
ncbi:MAG: Crp/Fnr family transcriptional regulator [Hyphomicrobiaceae bacterium]